MKVGGGACVRKNSIVPVGTFLSSLLLHAIATHIDDDDANKYGPLQVSLNLAGPDGQGLVGGRDVNRNRTTLAGDAEDA